jgi:hypothetical protein
VFPPDCDRQRSSAATHSTGSLRDRWAARLSSQSISRFDAAVCSLWDVVSTVAFWIAVAVPFLYLPLVVRGLETQGELVAFVALLGINLLALGLGHQHRHPQGVDESA